MNPLSVPEQIFLLFWINFSSSAVLREVLRASVLRLQRPGHRGGEGAVVAEVETVQAYEPVGGGDQLGHQRHLRCWGTLDKPSTPHYRHLGVVSVHEDGGGGGAGPGGDGGRGEEVKHGGQLHPGQQRPGVPGLHEGRHSVTIHLV